MTAGALAFRAFLTFLLLTMALLAWQLMGAMNDSTTARQQAVLAWGGDSDVRKGYGEEFLSECRGGFALLSERRPKASNPKVKTCAQMLARSESALRFGLTEDDTTPLEVAVYAAYANNPLPAPLSWL